MPELTAVAEAVGVMSPTSKPAYEATPTHVWYYVGGLFAAIPFLTILIGDF